MIDSAGAVPVFYETAAYKSQVNGSDKIGSWEDFTKAQTSGYAEYKDTLKCQHPARVCPVNQAFAMVRQED